MKTAAIGIVLALSALAWSQDATIYILPAQDAVQGKELHEELKAAQQAYDKWAQAESIKLTGARPISLCAGCLQPGQSSTDLKFSKDFKAATPNDEFKIGSYGTTPTPPCTFSIPASTQGSWRYDAMPYVSSAYDPPIPKPGNPRPPMEKEK